MSKTPDIACVLEARALLGESPVWSAQEAAHWVDIRQPAIHRFDPQRGTKRAWPMPETVGSIGLRRSGGLVAALRAGFGLIDLATGAITRLAAPLAGTADMRLNDGRCDRRGRFWAGALHEKRVAGTAALYRLDPDGTCTEMDRGFTIANGTAWSPDDRTMYFADSSTRTVFAYDFDLDRGALGNRRVFAQLAEADGMPDGATVDAEGFLWLAHFDGWRITRFAPDGRVDRVIAMPVPRPTSCGFGGADHGVLYVTSAAHSLSAEMLAKAPLSGGIFALDVGVKGLPEPAFAG